MSNENRIETVEVKNECFCKSIWFKKFLTKTLAVFIGVYTALSLFAALHKPPMPPCPYAKGPMMRSAMHHHHHFYKQDRFKGDYYQKKIMKDRIAPDKVKIEVKD